MVCCTFICVFRSFLFSYYQCEYDLSCTKVEESSLNVLMCIGSSNGSSSWCYKFILTTFLGAVFISRWHSCVSVC